MPRARWSPVLKNPLECWAVQLVNGRQHSVTAAPSLTACRVCGGISEGNPLFHLLWSGSGVVLFILHACELLGKDKAGVGTVHRGLGGCRELHGSES